MTSNRYAWQCRPCAEPVLWGSGVSPYASSPGGLCACCGTTTTERIEYRPLSLCSPSAPRKGASDLGSRGADSAAVIPPPPPPGTQLSLF